MYLICDARLCGTPQKKNRKKRKKERKKESKVKTAENFRSSIDRLMYIVNQPFG